MYIFYEFNLEGEFLGFVYSSLKYSISWIRKTYIVKKNPINLRVARYFIVKVNYIN